MSGNVLCGHWRVNLQATGDIVRKTCTECGEAFERPRCAATAKGFGERCRLAVSRLYGTTCAQHDPESAVLVDADMGARLLEAIRANPGSARTALMRHARLSKNQDARVARLLGALVDEGVIAVTEDSSETVYGHPIRRYSISEGEQ